MRESRSLTPLSRAAELWPNKRGESEARRSSVAPDSDPPPSSRSMRESRVPSSALRAPPPPESRPGSEARRSSVAPDREPAPSREIDGVLAAFLHNGPVPEMAVSDLDALPPMDVDSAHEPMSDDEIAGFMEPRLDAAAAESESPGEQAFDSTPPPSMSSEMPDSEREEVIPKELLAQFTHNLVQSANKSGYYDASHPAYHSAATDLHEMLVELIDTRPQITFMVHHMDPVEIYIDGFSSGRISLGKVMPAGQYEMFAARFAEYFARHDLVLIAFRRGITFEEFREFVSILAHPIVAGVRSDVAGELAAKKIVHMAALISDDMRRDQDLPWQLRIALARFRRDLRAIPFYENRDHKAIANAKRQLFQEIIHPIANAELLKKLLAHADRITVDLQEVEGFEDIDLPMWVVRALAPRPLRQLASSLCDELGDTSREAPETFRFALRECADRLVRQQNVEETEPILRKLHDKKVLAREQLPAHLQDWMRAEEIHASLLPGAHAGLSSDDPRDLRVLGRLGQLVASAGRLGDAADIAERLRKSMLDGHAEARESLEKMRTSLDLDHVAAAYEEDRQEFKARILVAYGDAGARALARAIADRGAAARMGRAYHLLDKMVGLAGPALVGALRRLDIDPKAVRLLLALAAKHPCDGTADAASHYLHHEDGMVRQAALSALAASHGENLSEVLNEAVEDPEPGVSTAALLALSALPGEAEKASVRALSILTQGRDSLPAESFVAAIEVLARNPGVGVAQPDAIAALRKLLALGAPVRPGADEVTYGPKAPSVTAAARVALRRIEAPAGTLRPPRG